MDKPIRWLHERPQTPPVGAQARQEMGGLLRMLQQGERISLPLSRPMPDIGRRCHELRILDPDTRLKWRLVYRLDDDAIVVVYWWAKKTQRTAKKDLSICQKRLAQYDQSRGGRA